MPGQLPVGVYTAMIYDKPPRRRKKRFVGFGVPPSGKKR